MKSKCFNSFLRIHPKFLPGSIDIINMASLLRSLLTLLIIVPVSIFSEEATLFRWKLKTGDDLELNEYHKVQARQGNRIIRREDKNRIVLRTEKCDSEGCELAGIFNTYTKFPQVDPAFYKDRTYKSRFLLTELGEYKVPAKYIMPNLRSLPSFSETAVETGSEWTKPATESFQFSQSRMEIPVQAKYTFKGTQDWAYANENGRAQLIEYTYTLLHDSEVSAAGVPYKIYGFAKGQVYFDADAGIPQYKHIQLVYTFLYPNGISQEMSFDIHGLYSKQRSLSEPDKDQIAEEVKKILGPMRGRPSQPVGKKSTAIGNGLHWPEWEEGPAKDQPANRPPVEVRKSEEGVTLSLDNLLFDTNRSDLQESSKEIISKIADVLKKYPDKEIRISGHTDDRGSQEYNLKLSQERALSVLKELRDAHGIEQARMSYRGYGKSKPISDNSSEESRAKNRRVDITIVLD
nr:OmpA family protein [Leptospira broomii]